MCIHFNANLINFNSGSSGFSEKKEDEGVASEIHSNPLEAS
jgi:hypothetical protein